MVQGSDRGTTEQPERALYVGAQNFERSVDSCLARGAKAVSVGSTYQDRASAEANGLDDIGAATNASIHQHFNLISDGFHNLRQDIERGGRAVQLPPSMIRHDNRRSPNVDCAAGILGG
jgi:hypothetical protein